MTQAKAEKLIVSGFVQDGEKILFYIPQVTSVEDARNTWKTAILLNGFVDEAGTPHIFDELRIVRLR